MRLRHARSNPAVIVAIVAAAANIALPNEALAQPSPALELDSPTGESPTAPPREGAVSVPGEAEADDDLTDVAIPEPPGAQSVPEVATRYPIPTPGAVLPDEPAIRIPSRITTRLRALDANLQALAARGGSNIVNAVLSLLTGGLAITLGAVRANPDDPLAIYLYVYGGASAIRGVLELTLTPNAQDAAITYQHMPMTSHEEVRDRLRFGERALAGLAEQSLIQRVLDASLNMAAAVAVIPVFAAKSFEITDPLDYFALIGAGISLVSGIITLASTSPAEQRWSAYQELRRRLQEERREELARERSGHDAEADDEAAIDALDAYLLSPPPTPSLRLGVGGAPSGGLATLSLSF